MYPFNCIYFTAKANQKFRLRLTGFMLFFRILFWIPTLHNCCPFISYNTYSGAQYPCTRSLWQVSARDPEQELSADRAKKFGLAVLLRGNFIITNTKSICLYIFYKWNIKNVLRV